MEMVKKCFLFLTNIPERLTFFRKSLVIEEFKGNLKLIMFLLQHLFICQKTSLEYAIYWKHGSVGYLYINMIGKRQGHRTM